MISYKESTINETENYRIYESGYEVWDGTIGALYKQMRRDYGRCTSYVYIDVKVGAKPIDPSEPPRKLTRDDYIWETIPVGWVFTKRAEYTDAHSIPLKKDRTFLQSTWITVFDGMPQCIHPNKLDVRKAKS